MNRLLLFILHTCLSIMISCDRKDNVLEDYFQALIDGEKFDADFVYASRHPLSNSITIYASNVNLFDLYLTENDLKSNPDYKLFQFSFQGECINERMFTWEEINVDTSCIEFIYEFNDSTDYPYIKAIIPHMINTDGYIEIELVNNEKNGSIIGYFEITGRDYNESVFTDTIRITQGEFRCQLRSNETPPNTR